MKPRQVLIADELKSFTSTVGIQGIRYLSDGQQGLFLKAIWFVIVSAAFLFSGISIWNSVLEWQNNPVVITIETTDYPVEDVPFPTVTICPEKNEPSCFEIVAKMFDFIEFPIFLDENSTRERTLAREKLQGFDRFLSKITLDLQKRYLQQKPKRTPNETYSWDLVHYERVFAYYFLHQVECNVSTTLIMDLLREIRSDFQNIPGPFDVGNRNNLYQKFIIPKLGRLLKQNGLKRNSIAFSFTSNLMHPEYSTVLERVIDFIDLVRGAFIIELPGEFLESRPDFYLGRLLSIFASSLRSHELGLGSMTIKQSDAFGNALNEALKTNLTVIPYFSGASSCLSRLGEQLLPQHYDVLIETIKHSQLGNTMPTPEERERFFTKFVSSASILSEYNKARPKYLNDSLKFLDFCSFGSFLTATKLSLEKLTSCKLFQTTITGQGLCYTFNGLPMGDVFKRSPVVDTWNDVFGNDLDVQLEYPTGYGPNHGLTVVLNMFDPESMEGSTKKSILSVTNEQEWVNIIANNYKIQPGFSYIFKVAGSTMVTTDRFDEMNTEDRHCLLPHEVKNSSLMNSYSKGGCLYECAIDQIIQNCNCTSWNIPRKSLLSPPFCESKYVSKSTEPLTCMDKVYADFSAKNCDCPSNCRDKMFSVFDYREPLDDPGQYCSYESYFERKDKEFPYNAFCNLCRKTMKYNQIYFTNKYSLYRYDNYASFCKQFLMKNVAIIKVELATPSFTQSVRDKRYNFESQLSGLGGTLGLFLGMSIISIFEVILWIIQMFFKIVASMMHVRRLTPRSGLK